jgi:AraC family transcriptional regulator of adaptative response / DNA-3-methyladenine glycosylase II
MPLDLATCERARQAKDPRFDGRFFIAVTSTGIYCRPICPAPSPKSRNIRYYPSAAAAQEAGFRPCLRCRPETSPGTPAWDGASASVSRALKLISESALDQDSVEVLAGRVGLGGRHLRRLFLRYLGATPVAVAQTRRVHFAKKLIDETDLPMTEVALASGFGSVRRFNDLFLKLYGRAPTDLRRTARIGNKDEPAQPGDYTFRLDYRPPFDWASLLQFLRARAIPGVEEAGPLVYRRTIALAGSSGSIAVRKVSGKDTLELQIRFPDPRALLRIVERVKSIFDLRADPTQIERDLRIDTALRPLLSQYPGLRVPGCWDGFELAVRAILGQQVSVKAASTLAGRLARQFGKPVEDAFPDAVLFPEPETIYRAQLEEIGLTEQRASAIRGLAGAVMDGSLVLDGTLSPENLQTQITRIPGIGPWTAQYVAMRLGEPDAFPESDLYLKEHAYLAESWRPWRAYAAMYLWRIATAGGKEQQQ